MTKLPTPEQIEGNVLIALATGWKFNQTEETADLYPMGYWVKGDDKDWCKAEDFKFHCDWNWLIEAYNSLGMFTVSTVNIFSAWFHLVTELTPKER